MPRHLKQFGAWAWPWQRYAIGPHWGDSNAGVGVSVGRMGSVYLNGRDYLPSLLVYHVNLTAGRILRRRLTGQICPVYVNGICEDQTANKHAPGRFSLLRGRSYQWSGALFPRLWGLIDEASVYNLALSDAGIAAIYNASSAGKCSLPPMCLRNRRIRQ